MTDSSRKTRANLPPIAALSCALKLVAVIGIVFFLADSAAAQPAGVYYLLANGSRLKLDLHSSPLSGSMTDEATGARKRLDNLRWDATTNFLEFRRNLGRAYQWYRLSVIEGVAAGRFSHANSKAKPPLPSYVYQARGWNQNVIDSSDVPRTWDISINGNGAIYNGVLRIDRNTTGDLVGQLKIFSRNGQLAEEVESELSTISWDGTTLSFDRNGPGFTQHYAGSVNAQSGRFISGTWNTGSFNSTWSGTRAQVLGFGLGSRVPQLAAWQARFRSQVLNLTEGFRMIYTNIPVPCQGVPCDPITSYPVSTNGPFKGRDDGFPPPPPDYTIQQTTLRWLPGSRFDSGNPPPAREVHVLLATPNSPRPANGWPLVIAVNGHSGSASGLFDPGGMYWYGDSAARNGFMVLAVDILHRTDPVYPGGCSFSCLYPSIKGQNYTTSDWEEDGERAFDVRRALDWAMAIPSNMINANRVLIFGLSMGGEVATITAALDPRIKMAVVSGYSPDMHVMDLFNNHPCYRWYNGLDTSGTLGNVIHEYLDVSDYEAAIAPRRLIVETGANDSTFSAATPPWQGDKQVTRRARAAYGTAAPDLVHVLHSAPPGWYSHVFRVGGLASVCPSCASTLADPEMLRIFSVTQPSSQTDWLWQTDSTTTIGWPDIYKDIAAYLP